MDESGFTEYRLDDGTTVAVASIKHVREVLKHGRLPFDAVVACSSRPLPSELAELPNLLGLNFCDTLVARRPDAFNDRLAADVAEFLNDCDPVRSTLFCCDAGQSRSPALAAAFINYLGYPDDRIWDDPHLAPNTLVYQVMMRAFGMPVSDQEAQALSERSEQALAAAIQSAGV